MSKLFNKSKEEVDIMHAFDRGLLIGMTLGIFLALIAFFFVTELF